MSNQTKIQDKKQMMNHEQITAVLASDDPVQLKRLIAMLGWYGNSLLGGMEMRGLPPIQTVQTESACRRPPAKSIWQQTRFLKPSATL